MRRLTGFATSLITGSTLASGAFAHALAQRYDLPLPLGFFLTAAGAAVAVSFLILAIFWRRAGDALRFDRAILDGSVPTAVVVTCRILATGALVLIVAAGLFGQPSTFKNIAPVAVWVIWWVGFSFLSAFVGNIWSLLNPWTAVFDTVESLSWVWAGKGLSPRWRYPDWLGAWPACALFLLFAWLELVAPARDLPRNVGIAVAVYSALTWAGFVAFGRDAWLKGGETFSIAFELFGRFAPLHLSRSAHWHWRLRPYVIGLLTRAPLKPSLIAFTLLLLATVTVDGLMETPTWAVTVEPLLASRSADANWTYLLLATALLVGGPLVLAGLYLGVVAMMARLTGSSVRALAGWFVLSLVPIAIAYHLAHYASLFVIAGQFIIPLISDPFGYGWNLFGTTLYRIDIGIVDARFIWYLSVIAIVIGHIVALWIGHVTAFAVFTEAVAARRSQYPLLVLMVGYTMLSLWIIAQPIVETGAK